LDKDLRMASDDLGKLVLRLTLGILLLFHGVSKLMHGVSGIEGMVAAHGLPAFFGSAVYIGEVVAPILLIIGMYTRLAGWLVVINMIVAFILVHSGQLFEIGGSGGWKLELQGFYLFCGLAVALLGAGSYSVKGRGGKWN
jgi:putative oxidoreductase